MCTPVNQEVCAGATWGNLTNVSEGKKPDPKEHTRLDAISRRLKKKKKGMPTEIRVVLISGGGW